MSLDLYLDIMLTYGSSVDDDYLQNASAILEKLKSFYRQGGESSNLSKLLQDYTQVLHSIKLYYMSRIIVHYFINELLIWGIFNQLVIFFQIPRKDKIKYLSNELKTFFQFLFWSAILNTKVCNYVQHKTEKHSQNFRR